MSHRALPLALALCVLACGAAADPLAADGAWKERTEVVWSGQTHALIRKTFRVWDPHPELGLVFLWEPRAAVGADPDVIAAEGLGTLSWHAREAADYDRQFTYSVFKGPLKAGRPEGQGSLVVLHTGRSYTGQWLNGRMHGRGVLRLENGDTYEGEFVDGMMQGVGRYSAADGSVYIGEFRGGVREGVGSLMLAEGTFRTSWQGGREVAREPIPDSRPLQRPLVQLAANQSGTVKLGLSLDGEQNVASYMDGSDTQMHTYEADSSPGLMTIHLGVPQILDAWKGNGKLTSPSNDNYSTVFMKAEIGNTGSSPAHVTSASLVVADSVNDPQPYFEMHLVEDRICDQISSGYSPNVMLANLGWSPVKDAKLTYSFGTADRHTDEAAIPLASIDASSKFSILSRLRQLRVDTDRLEKANIEALHTASSGSTKKPRFAFVCESTDEGAESDDERAKRMAACFQQVKESGVLGDLKDFAFQSEGAIYTTMVGRLDYRWTDSDGKAKTRTSPFSLDIPLVSFHIEMGEGGCEDSGAGSQGPSKSSITLALDRHNYEIALPRRWDTQIGSNQKVVLPLSLSAAKSSEHKFQIVLKLADGNQVTSPVIALSYFRPRPSKAR